MERMSPSAEMPNEFDDLPEPARSKALEFFQELIASGSNKSDALSEARERAQHWIAERVRPAS